MSNISAETSFMLIKTSSSELFTQIGSLENVSEVYKLYSKYDIMVKVEGNDMQRKQTFNNISELEGIKKTLILDGVRYVPQQ